MLNFLANNWFELSVIGLLWIIARRVSTAAENIVTLHDNLSPGLRDIRGNVVLR